MKRNRIIDAYINQKWAIDPLTGLAALAQYEAELSHVNSGGAYSDLGMSAQRSAMLAYDFITPTGEQKQRIEGWVEPTKGSIAVIKLIGTMINEGGGSSYGIRHTAQEIRNANANPNISGILLEGNTGGGEVTAGQTMFNVLSEIEKPLVVYADMLASGGIWGTLGANEIIATGEESRFGSIGVMWTINMKAFKKYNKNFKTVYAALSADKNKAFRQLPKTEIIQEIVDDTALRFQNLVRANRPLMGTPETISETLRGGMFKASDALERGLIDGIGDRRYALERLRSHIEFSK